MFDSLPKKRAARVASPEGLDDTPRRLLDAGTEVFVKHGYHRATVREICQRAPANVAAINYHFGGKEELYTAVLRRAYQESIQRHDPTGGLPDRALVRDRLLAFVHAFLRRLLGDGDEGRLGKLLSREIIEPTSALDALAEREMRPVAMLLEKIVKEILGPAATPSQVRLSVLHIAGQCLFHHHSRPIIDRLYPGQGYAASDIDAIAKHITDLSLAGLRGLRAGAARRSTHRSRGGTR